MRIIILPELCPYRNLAAEEYLMDNTADDVFMLWRNSPSVIIGRNQNAWAEVNTAYAEAHGIKVVRRLTGGGAVFHDPGNVNFTFITNAPDGETGIDFAAFTAPIIKGLASFGVTAELSGRNDLIADGFKISGNAQCQRRTPDGRRRLMHHGTLLYDADLTALAGALRPNEDKLRSKGIRSVSSRVKNIRDIGGLTMTPEDFMNELAAFAEQEYGTPATTLTNGELAGITALAEAKYSTWDWNFGKSPEHGETRSRRFPWGTAEFGFTVAGGRIKSITLTGDFFGTEDTATLTDALTDQPFTPDAVAAALSAVNVGAVISGATVEDIVDLLFNFVV